MTSQRHLLVVADSLAFHGPRRGELLSDERIYPNVAVERLSQLTGESWVADTVARVGWTARDAWWAMTMDPRVYSYSLPRADAVLLAVGSMDCLAASVPTYLREGIRFLRPAPLRRRVRRGYHLLHPRVVRVTRGRMRMLPQSATDHYLSRCLAGVRFYRPDALIVGVVPAPSDSPSYGFVAEGHAAAARAALAWGRREAVPMVDLPSLVGPEHAAGRCNPDGMHWGWPAHRAVGMAVADLVAQQRTGAGPGSGSGSGGPAYHG